MACGNKARWQFLTAVSHKHATPTVARQLVSCAGCASLETYLGRWLGHPARGGYGTEALAYFPCCREFKGLSASTGWGLGRGLGRR